MNGRMQNRSEEKYSGVPRPIMGALIGAVLFLLVTVPRDYLPSNPNSLSLYILSLSFETWGRLPVGALSVFAGIDLPESSSRVIAFILSMIPPILVGWMLGSDKRATKIAGLISMVIYLVITVTLGTLLLLMAI